MLTMIFFCLGISLPSLCIRTRTRNRRCFLESAAHSIRCSSTTSRHPARALPFSAGLTCSQCLWRGTDGGTVSANGTHSKQRLNALSMKLKSKIRSCRHPMFAIKVFVPLIACYFSMRFVIDLVSTMLSVGDQGEPQKDSG